MNRYELRQFNAKKQRGLIGSKVALSTALGLDKGTLDGYAFRHPEAFPKPAYVIETSTGGFRMLYNKSDVVAFLEAYKGVKKPRRAVAKTVGVSKYTEFLQRLEAQK